MGCGQQVRVGMGGVYGLDFVALLTMASVLGADQGLLAELLPQLEQYVVLAHSQPAEGISGDLSQSLDD